MDTPQPRLRWLGVTLSLVAVFIRAIEILVTRELRLSLDVFHVTFWRFALGLIVLLSILSIRRIPINLVPLQHHRLYWLRNLSGIGAQLLFTLGLPFLSIGVATALFYSHPLMITIGSAWIFKYQVRITSWIAIMIATCGVIILTSPTTASLNFAMLIILTGAALAANTDLTLKKLTTLGHSSLEITVTYFFAGSIVTAMLLPFGNRWPTLPEFGLLILMASLGLLFQLLHYQSFRYADPATLSPIKPTALAWNVLIDVFVYNTSIPTVQLIGMVLIGTGAALTGLGRNRA
jgi:drug/metabolite transporter (DMT)-like permease